MLKSDNFKLPADWSRDGRYLIYREIDPKTEYDVWVLPLAPLDGKQQPFPFLQTEANEAAAVLSPDGRWLAYASDVSGNYAVYVQSFPGGDGKRQVSTGGGCRAALAERRERVVLPRVGRQIDGQHRSRGGTSFEIGTPVALFEFRAGGNIVTPYYSVTKDGQKFLLNTIVETEPERR